MRNNNVRFLPQAIEKLALQQNVALGAAMGSFPPGVFGLMFAGDAKGGEIELRGDIAEDAGISAAILAAVAMVYFAKQAYNIANLEEDKKVDLIYQEYKRLVECSVNEEEEKNNEEAEKKALFAEAISNVEKSQQDQLREYLVKSVASFGALFCSAYAATGNLGGDQDYAVKLNVSDRLVSGAITFLSGLSLVVTAVAVVGFVSIENNRAELVANVAENLSAKNEEDLEEWRLKAEIKDFLAAELQRRESIQAAEQQITTLRENSELMEEFGNSGLELPSVVGQVLSRSFEGEGVGV